MPYEHILVAVDLTDECDPVINRASESAKANGAKLSLIHIVEPMAMAFGGDVPMDLSQLQQQQFDQAKERLERLIAKYPQLHKDYCHLNYGQPRQEIDAKEQAIAAVEAEMADSGFYQLPAAKTAEVIAKLESLQAELEQMVERWAELDA